MKKTIIIITVIIISLLFILTIPIPIIHDDIYGEGSAVSFNSLTYQIIKWDMYPNSLKPYKETEVYILPNNFQSTEKLWEERYNDLMDDGYGAILSYAVVTEKNETDIIVKEDSSDDNLSFSAVFISKKEIEKNNISFNDLEVGDKLKIANDGWLLESYPSYFGRIHKIELYE